MARVPGREAVYEVADLFRQRCLIEGRSLLWPDQAIWTVENLDAFWTAFVGNPDTSGDSFISKFGTQLANESNAVHQIAVDLAVLYCLFPSGGSGGMGTAAKLKLVEDIRSFRLIDKPPNQDTWRQVNNAFGHGIGGPGAGYLNKRPFHVAFYLRYSRELKQRAIDLGNAVLCATLADEVTIEIKKVTNLTPTLSRHMILHLLFPELFERVASPDHKRRIFDRFAAEADVAQHADLDAGLLRIRDHLKEKRNGADFDFYDADVRQLWDPPQEPAPPPIVTPPDIEQVETRSTEYSPPSITALAAKTHLDEMFLREIESLLEEKRQLIFEGPPGSGKTFVAELFARCFTGQALDDEPTAHVEIVQFHQSYGYEDFVQGIRPETNTHGQLTYNVRDGIFLELCRRAANNPGARFVLLIDEINRGNISRIFGELILLLEYRDKRARLPYATGDNPYLTIPKNLYIIGSMNSADRSLAQVDYALRRRFYFVRFMPVENGQAVVLDRWLQSRSIDETTRKGILARFVALNDSVSAHLSHDYQIGHSYFMNAGVGTDNGFNRIWTRAIQPLLGEYFHHHRERDTILDEIRRGALDTAPTEETTNHTDFVDDVANTG